MIKRRSVAQEACDGGRIEINGKVVKPAKEVKIGDIVTVTFGNNSMSFEFNYIGGKKEIVLVLKTNIVYIKVKERNEAK